MTGLAARGLSIRAARTAIEVSVLAVGFVLGGSVGLGTVAYALAIGPMVHFFLPRLALTGPDRPTPAPGPEPKPPTWTGAPCPR